MEEIHLHYCPKPHAVRRMLSLLKLLTTVHHQVLVLVLPPPNPPLDLLLKAIEGIALQDSDVEVVDEALSSSSVSHHYL